MFNIHVRGLKLKAGIYSGAVAADHEALRMVIPANRMKQYLVEVDEAGNGVVTKNVHGLAVSASDVVQLAEAGKAVVNLESFTNPTAAALAEAKARASKPEQAVAIGSDLKERLSTKKVKVVEAVNEEAFNESAAKYREMKFSELRIEATSRGIKASGKAEEIIERLVEADLAS